MINKPGANEVTEKISPIVYGSASSPEQMDIAAQLAKMAEAAKQAALHDNDKDET